jgi:hypothetical protein
MSINIQFKCTGKLYNEQLLHEKIEKLHNIFIKSNSESIQQEMDMVEMELKILREKKIRYCCTPNFQFNSSPKQMTINSKCLIRIFKIHIRVIFIFCNDFINILFYFVYSRRWTWLRWNLKF